MVDKIKQSIVENTGLLLWRGAIVLMITMFGWNINMFVGKISVLEADAARKSELCELKEDVKEVNVTLGRELPKISMFMGQTQEFMRNIQNQACNK